MKKYYNIPAWNQPYSTLSSAATNQREFFKLWIKELKKDNYIDIKGNLSYVFAYLYGLIDEFIKNKNIEHLSNCFNKIDQGYSCYKLIKDYLIIWLSDAYLYMGNYDKSWEIKRGSGGRRISDILNFKAKCKDNSINGIDLMDILGSDNGLTKFGEKHIEQVVQFATTYLKTFHEKYKSNLVESFCHKFNFSNLTEKDLIILKEYFNDEENFLFWKKIYEDEERGKYPRTYGHYIFPGKMGYNPHFECNEVPYIISVALSNKFKNIFREAENTIREEKNLPKVGEGWISENELFYKLCEVFPSKKIIHHGRPAWLSPQHLDIFFPINNIGIEYQGAQHKFPIDYFGGEKAFKKLQELDNKKKMLCEKNNCKLIYVYDGYDFEILKKELENILKN